MIEEITRCAALAQWKSLASVIDALARNSIMGQSERPLQLKWALERFVRADDYLYPSGQLGCLIVKVLSGLGYAYAESTEAHKYPHLTTAAGDTSPATWKVAHRLFMQESEARYGGTGRP
jgi:hypothetical protein